jgi:hypothetical protein
MPNDLVSTGRWADASDGGVQVDRSGRIDKGDDSIKGRPVKRMSLIWIHDTNAAPASLKQPSFGWNKATD